jgi:exodeoxyribonuclease III
MRIATWNVNSLKARQDRIEEWLRYAQPDVLCMQEVKLAEAKFPHMAFQALGYESVYLGAAQWNGVGILSKVGIADVETGFGADVEDPYEGEARFIAATCGGIRIASVYVPNGRDPATEFYARKLVWLDRLADWVTGRHEPSQPLLVAGDWNVAPEDLDVWSPAKMAGSTHVTPEERAKLAHLRDWGMVDCFRAVHGDTGGLYSWWDYRAGNFHKGEGLRIDLLYATRPVADRVSFALVDRNARKGTQPSDHAPVFIDLAQP